jgi:hypothetical protein
MALTNETADAAVDLLLEDLGLTAAQKEIAKGRWQKVFRRLYASLKADAEVVVTSVSGVTTGLGTSGTGTGTLA